MTRTRRRRFVRPLLEFLEARIAFNVDFGDAPRPYKTLLAEGGTSHNAVGPTLGTSRDTEADGVHTVNADGDDTTGSPDDEDGVGFGAMRVGQLGAVATVRVAGGSAKLNAWIDFNRDGSWGGPGEHIVDGRSVASGNNPITFDVPSWAADGQTFARFRVSSAGDLGPNGPAQNGEVEDYAVTIKPPKAAPGVFSGARIVSAGPDTGTDVYAADIDGDRATDFVSANGTFDDVGWYENDGSQFFTDHSIATSVDWVNEVFPADIDGDGDLDVLSVGTYSGMDWYENDGDQNFTARSIGGGNTNVHAADVDSDGDMDVLSASSGGNTIGWYENNGSQNFTYRNVGSNVQGAQSVFAADVDSDGDIDILSASRLNDAIIWYPNDGNQNFTAVVISAPADFAYSVYATDVDSDGDIDVLSASANDDKIAWYENDGNQNFTTHIITTAANFAVSVEAADIDGDGDVDVISTSLADDRVAWYENDGNENFVTHTISTSQDGPGSVNVADVDGDGDLDVFAASYRDYEVAWYENRRAAAVGAEIDPVGPPGPLPVPPPPAPIIEFETAITHSSRAPRESSGGASDILRSLTLPARPLGCDACAAPMVRRIGRLTALTDLNVLSSDTLFADISTETRLT